jgi:ribonuclease T2
MVLATDWPGGYQRNTWPDCVTNFTLHGLWPSTSDGGAPVCSGNPFDYSDLSSIIDILECQWPSIQGERRDENFWSHEWSKHGVCAVEDPAIPDELTYYQTALQLLNSLDILSGLASQGITPQYNHQYKISAVRSALSSAIGYSPVLKCSSGKLSGVNFCFSRGLKLQDCPAGIINRDDNCKATYLQFDPIKTY